MSRIGKLPIAIPAGVTVAVSINEGGKLCQELVNYPSLFLPELP